jgi:signal peptidase I
VIEWLNGRFDILIIHLLPPPTRLRELAFSRGLFLERDSHIRSPRSMKTASVRSRMQRWWRKDIRPFIALALILFSLRSSLADWNDVPSGSMRPTILEGDRVWVNKLAYDLKVPFTTYHLAEWANPNRGEIAVFYSPHDGKRLVKRVIGLPGDTIELRDNQLLLNGDAVAANPVPVDAIQNLTSTERSAGRFADENLGEHHHLVAASPWLPARRSFGPYTIPEGQYFMMGDNRDNSFDSRYYGPVPRQQILGRVSGVVLSVDREKYWMPRWQRFFTAL